jgi:POT family proton-dependent oligopeptide transporter
MSFYLLSIASGNLFTSLVNAVIQNPDGTAKLQGAAYYNFFAAIMFVTALLFIFVAMTYRERSTGR